MTVISISIPEDILSLVDAEATRQRRSRSFVVGEACRAYLALHAKEAYSELRDRTIREHLKLTPAERVRLTEALSREATRGVPPREPFSISFGTWAELDEWRRQGEPLPPQLPKKKKIGRSRKNTKT